MPVRVENCKSSAVVLVSAPVVWCFFFLLLQLTTNIELQRCRTAAPLVGDRAVVGARVGLRDCRDGERGGAVVATGAWQNV